MDSRYWAAQGHGAHRDGRALKVRDVDRLDDAVLAIGDYAVGPGATDKNRIRLNVTELLAGRALRVRMLGSAAIDLAWLAEGRLDASVTLSNRSWDVAAGVIIAREAGAVVLDYDGSQHDRLGSHDRHRTGIRDDLLALVRTAINPEAPARPDPVRRQATLPVLQRRLRDAAIVESLAFWGSPRFGRRAREPSICRDPRAHGGTHGRGSYAPPTAPVDQRSVCSFGTGVSGACTT